MNLVLAGLLGMASVCGQTTLDLDSKVNASENRIAFKNEGGLQNGGVCWWHSRLQRAAWLLAEFNPHSPAPSRSEALHIIQTLIRQNEVVTINGYPDFESFSRDHRKLIQHELELWQIRDGFINQQWIRGISGRSSLPAPKLRARMKRIFSEFEVARQKQSILWLMLQIRGVVSHSSLLIEMAAIENGYRLVMVDSNVPSGKVTYHYQFGDTSLKPRLPSEYAGSFSMVPYLGFNNDLDRIQFALKNYCK